MAGVILGSTIGLFLGLVLAPEGGWDAETFLLFVVYGVGIGIVAGAVTGVLNGVVLVLLANHVRRAWVAASTTTFIIYLAISAAFVSGYVARRTPLRITSSDIAWLVGAPLLCAIVAAIAARGVPVRRPLATPSS